MLGTALRWLLPASSLRSLYEMRVMRGRQGGGAGCARSVVHGGHTGWAGSVQMGGRRQFVPDTWGRREPLEPYTTDELMRTVAAGRDY